MNPLTAQQLAEELAATIKLPESYDELAVQLRAATARLLVLQQELAEERRALQAANAKIVALAKEAMK